MHVQPFFVPIMAEIYELNFVSTFVIKPRVRHVFLSDIQDLVHNPFHLQLHHEHQSVSCEHLQITPPLRPKLPYLNITQRRTPTSSIYPPSVFFFFKFPILASKTYTSSNLYGRRLPKVGKFGTSRRLLFLITYPCSHVFGLVLRLRLNQSS